MRLLIDLQGAQTGSRHRGIGRYSLELTKGIVRNRGAHEIFVLLNGLFPEQARETIAKFEGLLPSSHFFVFEAPGPVEGLVPADDWRRECAELMREAAIAEIGPDALLVTSLFEGAIDNGVTSVRRLASDVPTAVVLYDLIPYLDPQKYIPAPPASTWYYGKIASLQRADALLAISDSARQEALTALGLPNERVTTIFSAADARFAPRPPPNQAAFLARFGITRKFVMHTSAYEPRKNFDGLLRAFALLPEKLRRQHQLVFVAAIGQQHQIELRKAADDLGLGPDELVYAGHVSDEDLIGLYSLCALFVFPTFHEGFGLPPLEAMCCGAPAIGSNVTSIPEVIGRADALFDPRSDGEIARVMTRALGDDAFRASLIEHAATQSRVFSWDRSARLALRAIENILTSRRAGAAKPSSLLDAIAGVSVAQKPTTSDLAATAEAIARNEASLPRWREALAGASEAVDFVALRRPWWARDAAIRICILKLDHIGDFVIALDAFRTIRETWPKAHVTLVCGPWNKSLAERTGLFDEIRTCIFLAEAGADYDREALAREGVARFEALRLGAFDLAIDLRYYGDTRPLLLMTDAAARAGYTSDGALLDLALPEVAETTFNAPVGGRASALAAAVAWTFGETRASAAMLDGRAAKPLSDGRPVVGVATGTGNPIKSWGRERFRELARRLHDGGARRIVLIGGPRDRDDAAYVAQGLPAEDVLDVTGTLPIDDLAPLFAGLDLFVGNDTGSTHIAAGLGVPTICIFSGQSDVNSWRPVGPAATTLKAKVDCSPCYLVKLEDCARAHRCMNMSPARVAAEALALLDERRARAPCAPARGFADIGA